MRICIKKYFNILIILLASLTFSAPIYAKTEADSQEVSTFVQAFVKSMVKKHHFKEDELVNLFKKITVNTTVTEKMNKPYEAKPWYQYRKMFVSERRINNGLTYWKKHQDTLAKAEKKYGVPASVILAIIGVETSYGDNKGGFSVLEALTTLAFNYPKRSNFFKRELEHFLLLTREQKLDPLKMKGSYAGAIGLPQFMPSSYRAYAVDFSGKHQIDLMNNDADAIGSVANYLAKHGWRRSRPIACKADIRGSRYKKLLPNPIKPSYSMRKLTNHGITACQDLKHPSKALFFELKNKDSKEYWLGFHNFYVLSRYNHNRQYVLAVHQLSDALEHEHKSLLAKHQPQKSHDKSNI